MPEPEYWSPTPHGADTATILARACPACNAKPGEPCTRPTDTGRAPVAWFHYVREVVSE